MSRNDAMRDPFYAPVIFAIESKIHEADRLAAARGIVLSDSAIRSLLVRAINEARGKPAKSAPGASAKDQLIGEIPAQLASVRAGFKIGQSSLDGTPEDTVPLPVGDWILALEAVKNSCAIRTTGAPGSRGYLDYVGQFIQEATAKTK